MSKLSSAALFGIAAGSVVFAICSYFAGAGLLIERQVWDAANSTFDYIEPDALTTWLGLVLIAASFLLMIAGVVLAVRGLDRMRAH